MKADVLNQIEYHSEETSIITKVVSLTSGIRHMCMNHDLL